MGLQVKLLILPIDKYLPCVNSQYTRKLFRNAVLVSLLLTLNKQLHFWLYLNIFSYLPRKIFLFVGFEDILGKFEENNILAESSKAPKDSFSLLGEIDDNSSNSQTVNPSGLTNDRGKHHCVKCPNTQLFVVRIFLYSN